VTILEKVEFLLENGPQSFNARIFFPRPKVFEKHWHCMVAI